MKKESIDRLAETLRQRYGAVVEPEEVRPGRYRIDMLSPRFSDVAVTERLDSVWATVDETLSRDESNDITIIFAFAPGETEQFLPV